MENNHPNPQQRSPLMLDVSDILAKAIEEGREIESINKRRHDLESQIASLKEELEKLPSGHAWFVPQWRVDLDDKMTALIREHQSAQ